MNPFTTASGGSNSSLTYASLAILGCLSLLQDSGAGASKLGNFLPRNSNFRPSCSLISLFRSSGTGILQICSELKQPTLTSENIAAAESYEQQLSTKCLLCASVCVGPRIWFCVVTGTAPGLAKSCRPGVALAAWLMYFMNLSMHLTPEFQY